MIEAIIAGVVIGLLVGIVSFLVVIVLANERR